MYEIEQESGLANSDMMQAWPVSMVQHGSLCNGVDGVVGVDDVVGVDGVVGVGDVAGIGSDSETWPGCSIALWPWPMHPGLRHSKPWLRWVIHRFSHLTMIMIVYIIIIIMALCL